MTIFWSVLKVARIHQHAISQAIPSMHSLGNARKLQIWPVLLRKSDVKEGKSTDRDHNLTISGDGQDTSACKISGLPSMCSPGNAQNPIRTDRRTDGWTDGWTGQKMAMVGWMDQRTHAQVERGYFRLWMDGWMDRWTDGRLLVWTNLQHDASLDG